MRSTKFRPAVDRLEGRDLTACVFVVTNPFAQWGHGSLTQAVKEANRPGDRVVIKRGIVAVELLHPLALHKGVSLIGGPGGVDLFTSAPFTAPHNTLKGITIVPIGNQGGILDNQGAVLD
jgi:hypothetical protein